MKSTAQLWQELTARRARNERAARLIVAGLFPLVLIALFYFIGN